MDPSVVEPVRIKLIISTNRLQKKKNKKQKSIYYKSITDALESYLPKSMHLKIGTALLLKTRNLIY